MFGRVLGIVVAKKTGKVAKLLYFAGNVYFPKKLLAMPEFPLPSTPKFLQVYQVLPPPRRKKFAKWLVARIGHKQGHLLPLMAYFDRIGILGDAFDPGRAWKATQPGEAYNNLTFNSIVASLTYHLEDFLAAEVLLEDEVKRKMALMEAYQRLELGDLGEQLLIHARPMLDKEPLRDAAHYEKQYRLREWEYSMAIV